jgi:glucose-1-phosphate thymidylyltransferase
VKALILAGGYATRMGALALDRPKALLDVAGTPVLDYLVRDLRAVSAVDQIWLVTNHKFAGHFQEWAASRSGFAVRILDDGSVSNENRLGAIADLELAIAEGAGEDDLLVAAADNIFTLSFPDFVRFFLERDTDCITGHRESDVARLRQTGVIEINANGQVVSFEEKPVVPRSAYACPPLYLFKRTTLKLVSEYLKSGANPDAPGYFIQWLASRRPLNAFLFAEPRYAIGDEESYRRACEVLSGGSSPR